MTQQPTSLLPLLDVSSELLIEKPAESVELKSNLSEPQSIGKMEITQPIQQTIKPDLVEMIFDETLEAKATATDKVTQVHKDQQENPGPAPKVKSNSEEQNGTKNTAAMSPTENNDSSSDSDRLDWSDVEYLRNQKNLYYAALSKIEKTCLASIPSKRDTRLLLSSLLDTLYTAQNVLLLKDNHVGDLIDFSGEDTPAREDGETEREVGGAVEREVRESGKEESTEGEKGTEQLSGELKTGDDIKQAGIVRDEPIQQKNEKHKEKKSFYDSDSECEDDDESTAEFEVNKYDEYEEDENDDEEEDEMI